MVTEAADVVDGRLVLKIRSADGILIALLQLDFARERLAFDPFKRLAVRDHGTPRAIRYAVEALSVQRALVLNGQLEVWNSATDDFPVGVLPDNLPILKLVVFGSAESPSRSTTT